MKNFKMNTIGYFVLLIVLLTACKFQKVDSSVAVISNSLDSTIHQQHLANYAFEARMKIIKTDHEESVLFANIDNGCVVSFDVKNRRITDSCAISLISSELPVYEIYKTDSMYLFSYGFEDDVRTEIYNYHTEYDTVLSGFDLDDVYEHFALLSRSKPMDLNAEIYLYDLNKELLKSLDLFGQASFAGSEDELFIAVIDQKGNSSVSKYSLENGRLVHLFDFQGDVYLVGFNATASKIYFLGNNREGIFEYELGWSDPVRLVDAPIYSPVYSDLHGSIFWSNQNGDSLLVYPVY